MVKCWDSRDIRSALELAGVHRVVTTLRKPLIIGEIGASMRQEGAELQHELAWLRNTLEILTEWRIGYVGWAWHPEQHLQHGILKDRSFFSGPNEAGMVFQKAFSAAGSRR